MAKITVLLGEKEIGQFPMTTTPFVCGREAKGGVLIENVGVSRKHCQFIYEDGQYFVEDLGSSNGTFVGPLKVNRAAVRDGDRVSIGKYVLLFEDKGLEMLPRPADGSEATTRRAPGRPVPPGAAVGFGAFGGPESMKTFQVDPATLRAQMAKAGAAAAGSETVRRASDLARRIEEADGPVKIRKRRDLARFIVPAIKILGLAVAAAIVVLAILYVRMLVATGAG